MSGRAMMINTAAISVAALLLGACGGGGDDAGDATFATFATTTDATSASTASIASGKLLFQQRCAACHGSNMPAAKNSHNTLNAISSNRGGMGYLGSIVRAAQADDIAGYLAFGL